MEWLVLTNMVIALIVIVCFVLYVNDSCTKYCRCCEDSQKTYRREDENIQEPVSIRIPLTPEGPEHEYPEAYRTALLQNAEQREFSSMPMPFGNRSAPYPPILTPYPPEPPPIGFGYPTQMPQPVFESGYNSSQANAPPYPSMPTPAPCLQNYPWVPLPRTGPGCTDRPPSYDEVVKRY